MDGIMTIFTILAIILGILVFLYFVPINLWITAIFSGVQITLLDLVFMKIRKVPAVLIVNTMITLQKAGASVKIQDLEIHYLAGGDVSKVSKALIISDKSSLGYTWNDLVEIDLGNEDVFQIVKRKHEEKGEDIELIRKRLSDQILHKLDKEHVLEVEKLISELNTKGNVDY